MGQALLIAVNNHKIIINNDNQLMSPSSPDATKGSSHARKSMILSHLLIDHQFVRFRVVGTDKIIF